MCGRYAASKDSAKLVEEFEIQLVAEVAPEPNFNVAPTNEVAIVIDHHQEGEPVQRQLRRARWGLVPSWAQDPKLGSRLINARLESVAAKPAFRAAFAQRRCLVPADGYFEWYRSAAQIATKTAKQPFFIHRADDRALAMAGLYSFWRPDPETPWLVTVAVLTTSATGQLSAIHDRMPVLLDASAYRGWLDQHVVESIDIRGSLPLGLLEVRPVSTAVNSVRNNGPALLDALAPS